MDLFEEQFFISDIENNNMISGASFLMKAKKWINTNAHRFDVIHCLSAFHHSFMMAVWFERMGVPAVVKISESKYIGFNDSSLKSTLLGLRKYRQKHANDVSAYISISSEIKSKLAGAGIQPERIHDIPNGVDTQRFSPVSDSEKVRIREKLGIANKFTVIFTGSFSDRKNPHLIARAFTELPGSEDMQLLLVGPDRDGGIQRNLIRKLIEKNQYNNILLVDFVQEIELFYQASDIFVLPSNQEGLSNSMLEAQACGLPAIVTRISGAEDLIDESLNGSFIDFSTDSISLAINNYFVDRNKLAFHSESARMKIIKSFSSDVILQKHIDLFHSLI